MNAEQFELGADALGLDDFERIAAYHICAQLEVATHNLTCDRLYAELGALLRDHLDPAGSPT